MKFRLSSILVLLYLLILFGCAEKTPSSRSFYINLNDYPLYAKNGFNPADVAAVPDSTDDSWLVKRPEERKGTAHIESLGLPNMPPRFFFPLLKKETENIPC